MEANPRTGAAGSSNKFAHKRDAAVLWLVERHPATAGMLAGIGLFPTAKKASKRLGRLMERGQIRRLGTLSLKDGRPEHVYCRGRWKGDNLMHEVQLTRVCLKIHAEEVRRGAGQVDSFLRPDAELLIANNRYCLEMDCGTMSVPDVVQSRFSKYQGFADFVLWVCPSENRIEQLRKNAEMIRGCALFTTLDSALRNPHDRIWVDFDGELAALPRTNDGAKNRGDLPRVEGGGKTGAFSPPGCGPPTDSPESDLKSGHRARGASGPKRPRVAVPHDPVFGPESQSVGASRPAGQ